MKPYSTTQRREYIDSQLERYRPGEKTGHSYREIAWDIKQTFDLPKPPSAATIANDLKLIAAGKAGHATSSEADHLLHPDRFPEWRARFFRTSNAEPYQTPEHQHAWFWLIYALTKKQQLPNWVLEWYKQHDADLTDINDWVQNPQLLLTLWLLAPPRHGKTDLLRHTAIFLICDNPNVRIMWQSLNLPVSKLTTGWIKRELESNRDLILMYGPFQKDGNWSDKEFIVSTRSINLASPTMVALGKSEGTLSRDADIIIVDDFVDIKSSQSPTQVERDVNSLRSNVLTRREPWTPIFGIGSHQISHTGDAYEYMQTEYGERANQTEYGKTVFVKIKAHNYNNCSSDPDLPEEHRHGSHCLLWNDLRSYWFLEAQRQDLGDLMYEVTYNQEARRATINYFERETLQNDYPQPVYDPDLKQYLNPHPNITPGILDRERSYGEKPSCCQRPPNTLLTAIGFDPAAGETRHAAESALYVLSGCRHCQRRYIIEEWADRVSPEKHPDIIDQYAAHTNPHRVRIEANAYQKYLARDPRLRRSAAKRRYTIEEWFTDERRDDPLIGVTHLHTHMQAGKLSLPYRTAYDQERSRRLIRQLAAWPQRPNDRPIALWLADISITQLIENSLDETPETMPGYEHLPSYLKTEAQTIDLTSIREYTQHT